MTEPRQLAWSTLYLASLAWSCKYYQSEKPQILCCGGLLDPIGAPRERAPERTPDEAREGSRRDRGVVARRLLGRPWGPGSRWGPARRRALRAMDSDSDCEGAVGCAFFSPRIKCSEIILADSQ